MASFQSIALRLQPQWRPFIQTVRFRKRINIQRPFPPHYERAKVLAICRPIFPEMTAVPVAQQCAKQEELTQKQAAIDNPFEQILAKDLLNWFNHSNMIAFFHTNPMSAEEHFKANIALKKQNMTLKNYGHKTARRALENTKYEAVLHLFQSHNSIVFSNETHVAKLIRLVKKIPQLILMAGIVDGRLLSKNELVDYSRLPDLQIARAGLVTILNSAANQVIQHLNHHQSTLVSHLDRHIVLQQTPAATELLQKPAATDNVATKVDNIESEPVKSA